MDSYLDDNCVKEAVSVFKKFIEKSSQNNSNKRKDVLIPTSSQHLLLQINWKKIPPNNTTYDCAIGPLPYHWFDKSDSDVCLIVRDLQPKVFKKDRDMDLNETREHYKEKLIAAGFDDDFVTQRLNIIPMRELITEYKEYEAKAKLCRAYDVFLAEHTLMNNKNKTLRSFLGYKFYVEKKKMPISVRIGKLEGEELKNEIRNALTKTHLVITGLGHLCSLKVGLMSQPVNELSANLAMVLQTLKQLYGDHIAMLKLKTPLSAAIPIYADLRPKNDVDRKDFPRSKSGLEPIRDEFPLFRNTDVVISGAGNVRLKRKMGQLDRDSDPDEEFLDGLEKRWIRITNPRRKKKRVITFKRFFRRRIAPNSKTKANKKVNA
ncbi:Ribosomal protein L1p/L10e-like protein [Leptotrombidium deliense]|uniref:Ribosomal protein L1p/L10e-like protein n=1 Tax=Leptotrombidium deliense TaxID=299467 RepID=A0A443SSD5_9ACAR|nr:Ribosomal protein L1p/L10e-like protein [Leptotrombidium deliense]